MGSDTAIRIVTVGAGRMGQEVLRSLVIADGFDHVGVVDISHAGVHAKELAGPDAPDLVIEAKLGATLDRAKADVLIDFTNHSGAASHALQAIQRGVSPVIGATGMTAGEIQELEAASVSSKVPGIYAPNFAIGAVLMMRFAELAAKWLPDAEIIEMHHERKEDAPSGTAMLTAEKIAHERARAPLTRRDVIKAEGARGASVRGIPVHSVRLPGFVAHQAILFGGLGETLTIRHDSTDRKSFMEGVKLCVREVRGLSGFVVGMDHVLFRE